MRTEDVPAPGADPSDDGGDRLDARHEPAPSFPAGDAAPEPGGPEVRADLSAGAEATGHTACREAALACAARGWAVLPLRPRGKEPLTKHGARDATTDPAKIEEWWNRWPDANVGIATGAVSGLAVLDIDPRNGGDEGLRDLLDRYHGWGVLTDASGHPETYTVLTGGGGKHFYFAADGTVPSRKLANGVDLKGDGGCVVAPPSVHPNGRKYVPEASTAELPPAPLPKWLSGAASERKEPLYRELEGEPVREGQRNDYLASLAGKLRHDGLSAGEIAAALLAVNSARCLPPLPEDKVRRIADSVSRYPAGTPAEAAPAEIRDPIEYFTNEKGTWRRKRGRDGGEVLEQLATFSARITRDITIDDGEVQQREFEIEATVNGGTKRFTVSASEFATMDWVLEHLGARAVVMPIPSAKDHLRAAIQQLSGSVPDGRIFTHLGWRKVDGRYVFLHAKGAVGADGLEVRVPAELERFVLPPPPEGDELRAAVRGALELLNVAPDRVTVPLLAAAVLPPLLEPDFAVHLAGPTGARKTELAALAQRFYGAGMDARHLPASWRSTANALETIAHYAKDCLLVVDDFVPTGSAQDAARLHREAEQLLRGVGNHAGRQRLSRDARLQPSRPARCQILSTGEDIPPGHSLRARIWMSDVEPGDVDLGRLTELQRQAANGVFARAMSGYLAWLAPQLDVRRAAAKAGVEVRRADLAAGRHGRTATAQAALEIALGTFLEFAVEAGAITAGEADRLMVKAVEVLGREAASSQAAAQRESDPARRFLDLLRSALGSGKAHIADVSGKCPETKPEVLGWRQAGGTMGGEWQPQGACIGWVEGDHIYLDPNAAIRAAQQAAPASEPFAISSRALGCALKQGKYLASAEESRGKNRVRKTINGVRREVFALATDTLLEGSREIEL